jgi:predicted HicB family RNase H-like nuclease
MRANSHEAGAIVNCQNLHTDPNGTSAGKEYSGKFVLRVGSGLHQLLAVRALQKGDSLNTYCAKLLKKVAP